MASPLLTTKIYIPQPRPNLIPRPRLVERINAGLGGNLTLISAPAGFGKTSLLIEWSHQSDLPVTWLSLDENDNDLGSFFKYVIAALRQIDESLGVEVLAALNTSQSLQTEILLTMLVNDIVNVESHFALVLDDCHFITNQSIFDALEFIVNHLPQQMKLVIISRIDPPIPFSRLRAGGQLTEIRSHDLRFTEIEAATFLNDVMSLNLSAEDIRALEKRTEGWIVGLQLAALSLQGRSNKHEFVSEFSGSHHYIIDYLMEEVLLRQSKELQSFLCRTAILERFNSALCNAILEVDNSRQILQVLEETNLFLTPLDSQRNWYRYHHLFSDFLRQCLKEEDPELISGLHFRASEWYEQIGLIPEAVRHSLAAEEYDNAARLVEQSAAQMLELSELSAVLKLVDMLPEVEIIARPRLCIYHSWALRLSGRPYDVVEARLRDAERALTRSTKQLSARGSDEEAGQFLSDDVSKLQCHITALNAYQALFREDVSQVLELAQQVQACCPEERFLCSSIYNAQGWAERFSGDIKSAIKSFSTSTTSAIKTGNIYFAVASQSRAAYALVLAGKLGQGLESLQEAVRMATEKDGRVLPVAGYAYVYMGGIFFERNDLASAEHYLGEGIKLCERVGYFMDQAVGCVNLVRLKMAQKEWRGAISAVQMAKKLSQKMKGYLYVQRWVEDGQLRLWLAQNNLKAIESWTQESGLGIHDPFDFRRDLEHVILARALVALGRFTPESPYVEDALTLLERLLETADGAGWMGKAVDILILLSLARQIKGEIEEALKSLEKALKLAEPEGYVRSFVDEGLPLAQLLQQAIKKGISPQYAGKLLAAIETEVQDNKDTADMIPLPATVEPITRREQDVLRLLATDLSGPEIARELMIALTTLRFHSRNIYSKLNVNNRRSAVRKAKELNLM